MTFPFTPIFAPEQRLHPSSKKRRYPISYQESPEVSVPVEARIQAGMAYPDCFGLMVAVDSVPPPINSHMRSIELVSQRNSEEFLDELEAFFYFGIENLVYLSLVDIPVTVLS